METFLNSTNINIAAFKRALPTITANEMTELTSPCYYPQHKKFFFQFLHYANTTEADTKKIASRFWKNIPDRMKLTIWTDNTTLFQIAMMHYFLKENEPLLFNYMMLLFGIRQYSNVLYKFLKFCDENAFRYTLENIAKTHLFAREKTIGNAIYFISKEMIKKYKKGILDLNDEKISLFIGEYRSRLNQSVRSFANMYYDVKEKGLSISVTREPDPESGEIYQLQSQDKTDRLIDDVVKKITVYKEFDKQSMIRAKQLTKINTSLATIITNTITNIKYSDNLKTIFKLFLKDVSSVSKLCGKNFIPYIRKLMGIKRTKDRVYFKQQVTILLMSVLEEIDYKDKYENLTNQTKFSINSFLAYYITLIFRSHICGSSQAFKRKK